MKTILAKSLLCLVLISGCSSRQVASDGTAGFVGVGYNFDWDDNIFFMKTPIVLFHKRTGAEREVSTGEFAEVRQNLGKRGTPWADFEVRPDPKKGSFRYFNEVPGRNIFLEDVLESMKADPSRWKGPSWEAFVEAVSREETARMTTLITARGHDPEQMHAALVALRDRGLIRFVPPVENLIPVGNPRFGGDSADPSARKAFYMRQFLDALQAKPVNGSAQFLSPAGTTRGGFHLWGFSDDDFGNFEKAKEELSRNISRWPKVKIVLFYTGTHKPGVSPHALVLTPDGASRPYRREEWGESTQLTGGRACPQYFRWLESRRPPVWQPRVDLLFRAAVG